MVNLGTDLCSRQRSSQEERMLPQARMVMEKEDYHYGFAKCKRYNPSYLSLMPEIDYLQLRGQFLQQEHHPAGGRSQAPAADTLNCHVLTELSPLLVTVAQSSGAQPSKEIRGRDSFGTPL